MTQPRAALMSATLVTATGALPVFALGAHAVPLKAHFSITDTELALVVAGYFLVAAATSRMAGRWVGHLGWPLAIILSSGASLVSIMMVAGGVLGGSGAALTLLYAVAGIGFALSSPASNLAIVHHVPARRGGIWFGVKQAGVPAGTAFTGLALWLVAEPWGWRWSLSCTALLPVVTIVLALRQAHSIKAGSEVRDDQVKHRPPLGAPAGEVGPPSLALVTVGVVGACVMISSSQAFFVVSAVAAGVDEAVAGAVLAAGSVLGVGSRLLMGWLVDRTELRALRGAAVMLAVGGLGAMSLTSPGHLPVLVGAALIFGFGWGWQGLLHYGVVQSVPQAPARATGVVMTGAALGMTVGPLGFAGVATAGGFALAWSVVAVLTLLATVSVLVGDKRLERRVVNR